MNLSKLNFKINSFAQEIEFGIILVWVFFYPQKKSFVFYLVAGFLFSFFTLIRIRTVKNVALYPFSGVLLLFNAVLVAAAFFSPYPLKSLMFIVDLLLISIYAVFFYLDNRDRPRYLLVLVWVVSVSSLVNLSGWWFSPAARQVSLLFENPILQGIASGIGAILCFHQLLIKRFSPFPAVALGVNLLALMFSGAKAAFLGVFLVFGYMLFLKRKKWLVGLLLALVLVAVVPNPFRSSVVHSLRNDPYVSNRIDIWKMSLRMFRDSPWTGIGPDMFSQFARRYNFPQEVGPARFGKVPESPHSDFLKLPVETGILGLFLILFYWAAAGRKIFSRPRFEPAKLLLLFLVFQMFFFNFVLNPTFFFVLIFVLKMVFEVSARFKPVSAFHRTVSVFLVLLVWVCFYLLPSLSTLLVQRAGSEPAVVRAFRDLNLAALGDPLNDRIAYAKAVILADYFDQKGDLDSWTSTLENLKKAEKLNAGFVDAYVLESNLHLALLRKHVKYPALADEAIAPLIRAERIDPFNPFIKLKKAAVDLAFGRGESARREALNAMALEPEFVSALCFLHENFGYWPDEAAFSARVEGIVRKTRRWKLKPGSYLYNLFQLPPGHAPGR